MGIRNKLTNLIRGKCTQTSRDRSAFGLPVDKITEALNKLKKNPYFNKKLFISECDASKEDEV